MTVASTDDVFSPACRARRAWRLLEPIHAVTYFADECHEEFTRSGLRGRLMSYVAGRSAPMGRAGADAVAAALFSFHPALIARVIPRAWTLAAPEAVMQARGRGIDRALRRILGQRFAESPELVEVAAVVEDVLSESSAAGRPMFAAYQAQPAPAEPHLRLWWAATLLREHRGDGHAMALREEDTAMCEAHMIVVAGTNVGRDWLRFRGFSEDDCHSAEDSLHERGWFDADHALTAAGRDAWMRVEKRTDEFAAARWNGVPACRMETVLSTLSKVVALVRQATILPDPYPPVG
jgi:hypothetical protein